MQGNEITTPTPTTPPPNMGIGISIPDQRKQTLHSLQLPGRRLPG